MGRPLHGRISPAEVSFSHIRKESRPVLIDSVRDGRAKCVGCCQCPHVEGELITVGLIPSRSDASAATLDAHACRWCAAFREDVFKIRSTSVAIIRIASRAYRDHP